KELPGALAHRMDDPVLVVPHPVDAFASGVGRVFLEILSLIEDFLLVLNLTIAVLALFGAMLFVPAVLSALLFFPGEGIFQTVPTHLVRDDSFAVGMVGI